MKVIPIPADGNFAAVAIEPGENVILKLKERVNPQELARIRASLERSLPGVRWLIIDNDIDLHVVAADPDFSTPPSLPEFYVDEMAPGVTETREGETVIDRRAFEVKEIRVVREEGKDPRIVGYAATFNQPSKPLKVTIGKGTAAERTKQFIETIAPGAFETALGDGRDIAALVGHQPNAIVARSSANKMKVTQDAKGLAFDLTPSKTQRSIDLLADIDHGNIRGMSFGMGDNNVDEWKTGADGTAQRLLKQIDLKEISFTPFPAYDNTSCDVRTVRGLEELEKRDHPNDMNYSAVAGHCRSVGQHFRSLAEGMLHTRDLLDGMTGKPNAEEAKHMRDMYDAMADLHDRCQAVRDRVKDALGIADERDDGDGDEDEEGDERALRFARYVRDYHVTLGQARIALGAKEKRAGHMTHADSVPRLNVAGVTHAKALIADGKTEDGEWSFTAADEDALLGPKGDDWAAYATWFLSIDKNADEKSKAAYKYPFGKDGKVFTRALVAIKGRATTQDAADINKAAGLLLDLIKAPAH